MILKMLQGLMATTTAGDPFWANVSALMHFDGVDGSTIFTDQTGKLWTPSGNAQIDTAQSKFGGASGLFDGAGDSISTPAHLDFGFSAGDFTVEFWVRPADAVDDECIFDNRISAAVGIAIYSSISSGGSGNKWGTANNVAVAGLGGNLTPGVFVHLAVCRQGTNVRGYRAGVQEFSYIDSRTYASSAAVIAGADAGSIQPFNGHLDDMRITKGVARYTANFTPPATAFPDGP